MSDNMARYKRHTANNASSCRDKRKAMEESMLEYHTRARQMNAQDMFVDHISRVTSLRSGIQLQFQDTYTEEATYKRQHHHPRIASLKPLLSTIEQEYYQTKRHEECGNPRRGNKSQGLFTVTPDEHYVGRRSKNHINAEMNHINAEMNHTSTEMNHINAEMNSVNAIDQYHVANQNSRNNILKQELARLSMNPVYGIRNQYSDYRPQRSLLMLDPLDIHISAHDASIYDVVADSKQSTLSPAKRHDINESSCVPTDKNIQIDLGFRRKQKLIPVRENENNVELQCTDCKSTVDSVNRGNTTNILRITSSPDFLQTQAKSQYADPASVPIRLLQRPQRAKRLDLPTPDLGVIPEAGNICAHSGNLELDRKRMLSSKPILIRNSSFISMNRSGLEKSRKGKDLKLQIIQKQKSLEWTHNV